MSVSIGNFGTRLLLGKYGKESGGMGGKETKESDFFFMFALISAA